MDFNLAHILKSMGPAAIGVAAALALMAVASLAVFLERLWVFRRSRTKSRQFAAQAAPVLERSEHGAFLRKAEMVNGSYLADLLAAGVRAYVAAERHPSPKISSVELARRELVRKTEALTAEVRRGLSVLASVGSVAPFIGLLGTVVGIIGAFQGIAREGSGGLAAVSAGIAEALVVTAFGLLVAIPSVLAFNFLTTRSERLLLELDQARGELLDSLETGRVVVTAKRPNDGKGHPEARSIAGEEIGARA